MEDERARARKHKTLRKRKSTETSGPKLRKNYYNSLQLSVVISIRRKMHAAWASVAEITAAGQIHTK